MAESLVLPLAMPGRLNMLQETSPSLQPFLDRLTSRSDLTRIEQDAVLSLPAHAIQTNRDQDFVRLGERVDHASFVVAGLVGRFDQVSDGQRQITALYIPGDMPDLFSVVQPTPTSAIQALSTATILKIPHRALREVARQYPALAEAFWRDCAVDAMIIAQWLVSLGRRNSVGRLAHLFCEMAVRVRGHDGAAAKYPLPMTQAHLADAMGITSVHVNRSLMSLRHIGVTFRGGVVRIADWQSLVDIADFDPAYLQTDLTPEDRVQIFRPASV